MSVDLQRIDTMDGRINKRGSELFFDEVAIKHGASLGVDNYLVFYGAGRAGVMGDVGVEQISSAFAYFAPGLVGMMWSGMDPAVPPSAVAKVFAESMSVAARERWDERAAATVNRIGRKVADHVTPLGLPLFAGWRAMAAPADELGAAAITITTLRELRGDIHIQSVAATGIGPMEADLATRGEEGAKLHGWSPPYPDVSEHAAAIAAAQATTSERMGRIYAAAISAAELDELDDAVAHLRRR